MLIIKATTDSIVGVFNKVLNSLLGKPDDLKLQNRLFNLACLINIICCLVTFIWNSSIQLPPHLLITFTVSIAVFGALYYNSRFHKKYNTFIFVITTLIGLSAIWFTTEGSKGSTAFLYLIVTSIFVSIAKYRNRYIFAGLNFLNLLILIGIEHTFPELIQSAYPTEASRTADIIFTFGATFFFTFFFMVYYKNAYERENKILNQKNDELAKLNATKNKFFSIISHDLRSPFQGIIGLSEILVEDDDQFSREEIKQFNKGIRDAVLSSYGLMENLLEWANVQQGLITAHPRMFKIQHVIEESIDLISGNAEKKNIQIHTQIDETAYINSDPELLKGILRNILSNAVKYCPDNGQVHIRQSLNDNHVCFEIEDSGIGMDSKRINELFKIGGTKSKAGTHGEKGSGIGLLTCKEFIDMLNGTIQVESKIGKGSIFKICIPADKYTTESVCTEKQCEQQIQQ